MNSLNHMYNFLTQNTKGRERKFPSKNHSKIFLFRPWNKCSYCNRGSYTVVFVSSWVQAIQTSETTTAITSLGSSVGNKSLNSKSHFCRTNCVIRPLHNRLFLTMANHYIYKQVFYSIFGIGIEFGRWVQSILGLSWWPGL